MKTPEYPNMEFTHTVHIHANVLMVSVNLTSYQKQRGLDRPNSTLDILTTFDHVGPIHQDDQTGSYSFGHMAHASLPD